MFRIVCIALVSLLLSCSGSKVKKSYDASEDLTAKYTPMIGSAEKQTFVQDFGNPQWCRPHEQGEKCRFFMNRGAKWMGEGVHKKKYDLYDEVVAHFDASGKLKSFKAKSQR